MYIPCFIIRLNSKRFCCIIYYRSL